MNKNNLGQIFINNKDICNLNKKSGIYRVECGNCNVLDVENFDIHFKQYACLIKNSKDTPV